MDVRCRSCGGDTPEGRRFCCDCGVRLDDVGDQPEEIRTVTVLFADVADSTAMAAELGLESVKAVMDRVFEVLYQVILQHGGAVDKYIGDCVMALFGAPLAFGDDPARAVRAGLAILRSVRELAPELEGKGLPAVRMRVGINTGPVICGAMGAGPERRFTVLGHAVNIAAHLQQAAPVGSVLVGAETARRIRGLFYLEEHPPVHARAPASLIRGERAGGVWLRPREILGREIETVGRAAELARLGAALEACIARREAQLVLVVGEPGIGKSRLLFELCARLELERRDVSRFVGFAHPLSAASPFSVAAGALRQGLGIAVDESPLEAMTKVHALLAARGSPSLESDRRLLARLLGLASASDGDEDPGQSPRRVLDLLTEVVDWFTDRHPTLLVVEDLHWCDPSTLELLEHLHARLAAKPLFLLGLTRPELLRERPELAAGERRARVDLGPLDEQALGQLLVQAVGPEGRRLLELIASRSAGNPYHAEELLRSLEERRVLVRRIDGWELRELPADLEIPPGVEAVTQARIDNLSTAQRRLFCAAAVAGRTFWDGLLRYLDEELAAGDLSTLVRRELVLPKQESSYRGQIEYSIVHDLTRDVAYRMLPEYRRAELHRRTAAWLTRQGASSPEELALVGRHLDLGGQPDEAAAFLSQAGDAAFAAAAYATAASHYSRAIEIAHSPKRLFDLLARRERVLNALGRWAEQRHDAERMGALAQELDEESRVEALLRLGRAQLNVGDLEPARAAFREAYQRALDLGDADAQARALRWLAMYHFNRSEHLQARAFFEQALQLADRHELEGLAAELAYELGVTVGTIGDYQRALDVSGRALEMYRRQGNRYQEAFCLGNIGCFHVYLGEHEEARAVLERAAELGRGMGVPLAEASAQANLGNALRLLRRPLEGLALEEQAHSTALEIGDVRLAADALVYAALAALEGGLRERALELADQALELARSSSVPGTEAAAQMALARVMSELGRTAEAVAASDAAVAILDRVGSVEGFEQEILLVHGELCGRVERGAEAERSLRRAREEIARKASYITAEERRRSFLRHAERVATRGVSDGA